MQLATVDESRVDDLFCEAINLRDTEWLSWVNAGDVYELAEAVLLSKTPEEGQAKAYAIFEAIAENWAEDAERSES